MPTSDSIAVVKWPKVPACYGWLSLDRRGCWRLQDEVVRHTGLINFINSHYSVDASGNWIFQNGPQKVFVALDYTPLVLHMEGDGRLAAHTGAAAGQVAAVYLDEEGNVLLDTDLGIGLLDDRDLPAFVEACRNASGQPAGDEALLKTMSGASGILWRGLPVQAIKRIEVSDRFGFRLAPTP